jgi:hypothetical protein
MIKGKEIMWNKKGLIFQIDNKKSWMQTHAQLPTVDIIDKNTFRIYFSTRNSENMSYTTYLDVMAKNPKKITYIHDKPILSLGNLGCFDESGIMPSWIITHNNRKYLYYIGWNVGTSIRYRVSLGLAISDDNGNTFNKISNGPVLDRNVIDPFAIGNQTIIIENDIWRMWYMSYAKWEVVDGITEPYYNIKYAESTDGINWDRKGIVCIDFKNEQEAGIARPFVFKENGIYKMYYSYRTAVNYRNDKKESYKIGYAESNDGLSWVRKDDEIGIGTSENGWDSEMICYPYIVKNDNKYLMFYNGNGFGKSGFGYAELEY